MKTAILASLIASAAAFAPAQQKATSTSLAAFEDELGVQVRYTREWDEMNANKDPTFSQQESHI